MTRIAMPLSECDINDTHVIVEVDIEDHLRDCELYALEDELTDRGYSVFEIGKGASAAKEFLEGEEEEAFIIAMRMLFL